MYSKRYVQTVTLALALAGMFVTATPTDAAPIAGSTAVVLGNVDNNYTAHVTAGATKQLSDYVGHYLNVESTEVNLVGASFEGAEEVTRDLIDGYTNTSARIRVEPSTNSDIIDLAYINTPIKYEESEDDWCYVEVNGKSGYIAKRLISDSLTEIPKPVRTASSTTNTWGGSKLNRRSGVNQGPSGKETYYNLPMNHCVYYMRQLGYNYSYWVRSDGVKMYGDYVMVACDTNVRPKGTILNTSLGLAMVCDHCEASESCYGQIDIAVTW